MTCRSLLSSHTLQGFPSSFLSTILLLPFFSPFHPFKLQIKTNRVFREILQWKNSSLERSVMLLRYKKGWKDRNQSKTMGCVKHFYIFLGLFIEQLIVFFLNYPHFNPLFEMSVGFLLRLSATLDMRKGVKWKKNEIVWSS